MKRELWFCPNCSQTSTRHWNVKTHIKRKHGSRQPIRRNQRVYPDTPNPLIRGRNRTTDNDPFAICDKNQKSWTDLFSLWDSYVNTQHFTKCNRYY